MSAVVYQSSQTATGTTSVVITKPTSLAVGDRMVAQILTRNDAATSPSGWNNTYRLQVISRTFDVFEKIADASDAAASTFTFTSSGNAMIGAISRFTGDNLAVPSDQVHGTTGASSNSPSDTGITPALGANTCLIMTFYDNSAASRTVSTYAVANNNPTWTEAYDTFGNNATAFQGIAMAYAQRSVLTATGAATASFSGSCDIFGIIILDIAPPSIPIAASTGTLLSPTVRTVVSVVLSAVGTLMSATPSEIANKWSGAAKSVTTWLNQPKS